MIHLEQQKLTEEETTMFKKYLGRSFVWLDSNEELRNRVEKLVDVNNPEYNGDWFYGIV